MAHVIVAEGLVNREHSSRRAPTGYDEFARSLEKFTPAYAEAISGVDRGLIVEAARMYATAATAPSTGAWASRSSARHRQRAGADPPGAAHRPHRAAGHGAESAARAEQRAGRIRRRRHALPLPGYMPVDSEENARKWERPGTSKPGGLSRRAG
jgi:hypothetical protein